MQKSIVGLAVCAALVSSAEQVIKWPSGLTDMPAAGLIYNASSENVVLDGTGATLGKIDTTTTYVKEPFKLKSEGIVIFDVESYWGDSTKQTTLPFIWNDFYVRLIHDSDAPQIHIDRGTLEIDPLNTGTRKTFMFGTYKGEKPLAMYVHGGNITFAPFLFSVTPTTSVKLRFDGGVHTQALAKASDSNNMAYSNGGTDVEGRTASFEVANSGTEFTFESEVVLGNDSFPNRTFTMLAENEGLLRFNKVKTQNKGTQVFDVKNDGVMEFNAWTSLGDSGSPTIKFNGNGGTYRTTETGTLVWGGGSGSVVGAMTNCTLNIKNCILYWGAALEMEGGEFNSFNSGAIAFGGDHGESGGSFTANGVKVNIPTTMFVRCGTTASFLNSSGIMDSVRVGANGPEATLNLSGNITNNNYFLVGAGSPGVVNFLGGKHYIYTTGSSPDTRFGPGDIGGNSSGTVNIDGGTEVFWGKGQSIYIANSDGSTGTVNVVNGSFHLGDAVILGTHYAASKDTATANINVYADGKFYSEGGDFSIPRGNFNFIQYGGEVYGHKLRLGTFGKTADGGATMRYEIRDGYANWDGFISVTENSNYRGEIVMTGGVLETPQVTGGGASACKGGEGFSALKVNGGTLKASSNNNIFITDFDLVEVGENGMIIDTAGYNVTAAAQDFTAAATGGKLIKRGAGTLTITGAVDENIEVVVEGGNIVFAEDGSMAGALTIKGGAVEFNTTQAITLAALTIGDDNSSGALELGANTTTLSVSGEVSIQNDASSRDLNYTSGEGSTTITIDDSEAQNFLISLSEGTSNATETITFKAKDTLTLDVASGANLIAEGFYQRGKLVKQGSGYATLTNPYDLFANGVSIMGGTFEVGSMLFPNTFTLCAGTLKPAGGEFNGSLNVNSSGAVIINTPEDTTLNAVNVTAGAIIKLGQGTLTIHSDSATTLATGVGKTPQSSVSKIVPEFDADGNAPSDGYAGFNIAEGEVVLAGTGPFNLTQSGAIGMNTGDTFGPVTLTLDGAQVTASKSSYPFAVGSYGNTATINLRNGAKISGDTPVAIGWQSNTANQKCYVNVDNSTMTGNYALWLAENGIGTTYVTATNGATMNMGLGGRVYGRLEMEVYGSTVNGKLEVKNYGSDWGYMRFNEGSVCGLSDVYSPGAYGTFALRFNGGTWNEGGEDKALRVRGVFGDYAPVDVRFIFEEGGATIPVANRLTVTHKLQGAGGFVKTGAGVMDFQTAKKWDANRTQSEDWTDDPITWDFTGTAELREGSITADGAAIREGASVAISTDAEFTLSGTANGMKLSGAGTVSGGTLNAATIAISDNVLNFAGTTFTGTTRVDFGRTAETKFVKPFPQGIVVARWTGTKPNTATWRGTNMGDTMLKADFTANDDGTITANIGSSGMLLLIR